jgi:prephenate dehydrogenase
MAGSEQGGVLAGRADLFERATWVLTPTARTRAANLERLEGVVQALGAYPLRMKPDIHDHAVARISHVPHVVAAALAGATLQGKLSPVVLQVLAAGGFRSTTRIAASPPEVWRDICLTNRDAILAALGDVEASLTRFRQALEEESPTGLLEAFTAGKVARDTLIPPALPEAVPPVPAAPSDEDPPAP